MSVREGLVVDRYVVERSIGKGGTAEVWSVRHRTLGTRRALKVLFVRRSDLHARLLEEGRAQARLSSDHIVPVLDVLDVDGAPALVMPLIEGPSLARLLEVHRPSEAEVAAILRALLNGVEAAHSAGLVHRDLKPSNVLLDLTSGAVQPRIADFGVARSLTSDVTRTGALLGTPFYAAPEQLRNAATADARADFWSLGVIVYELLTGSLPFRDEDFVALVESMEAEIFSAPGSDPRWAELVRDLLRARPEQRVCDFDEIRARIDTISPPSDRSPLGPGTAFATAAWRLRLPEPEAFAVSAGTIDPPPTRRDNLPRERDAFVGRKADALALRAHLERSPLVTVTGPGGVGKTRLVLHVARSLPDEFPRTVFCDLTEARSVDGILYAVARALEVALGNDPVTQLGHAVAGRGRFLFVLDNFEQVVDYAVATVGAWIERAPDAVFLITSREPLRLRGESVFPLDVLSLPIKDSAAAIDSSEAVSLFVTRAQQSEPSFRLAEDNAATVAQLVRQLDGLPLAIELAAARVRSSTPARLLERLSKRFDVLASASRDIADRQRSLRATLDWSWEQLTQALQDALEQLSVFDGGWTLEAAEFVVRLGDAASSVEEVLAELVDRSLVRTVASSVASRPRFRMLVSVHEYAAERLVERGGMDLAQRRHAAWFARYGTDEAIDRLVRHGGVRARHDLDLENLRAACRRAIAWNDAAIAGSTARAVWQVLELRGPMSGAAELIERVLEMPLDEAMAVRLRIDAGRVRQYANDFQAALAHLERALAGARALADSHHEGVALLYTAIIQWRRGHLAEADVGFGTALIIFRAIDDGPNEGVALGGLAVVHGAKGESDQARIVCEEALAKLRSVGHRRYEAIVALKLGEFQLDSGRFDQARVSFEEARALHQDMEDRGRESASLLALARLHIGVGRWSEGRACAEAALALARETGVFNDQVNALNALGGAYGEQQQWVEARECFEAGLALARARRDSALEGLSLGNLGILEMEMGDLDRARVALDAALGSHRTMGDKRLEGIVATDLGRLEMRSGNMATARQWLSDAEAIQRSARLTIDLAKLLCTRCELDLLTSNAPAARAALAEAERHAADSGSGPKSELGRRIAEARIAMANWESGAAPT